MKLTLSLYEITTGLYYSFYKDFPTKQDIIEELADIKKKLPEVKVWYFESVNANGNSKNKIFIFGQEADKEEILKILNSITQIPDKRIFVQIQGDNIVINRGVASREEVDKEFKHILSSTERRNIIVVN